MYETDVTILLMCESHDMRHTGFRRLTVVNGTLGKWGVAYIIYACNQNMVKWLKLYLSN